MYFDKIKKAAKDMLRKMSDKINDQYITEDDLISVSQKNASKIEDSVESEDTLEQTQKFDIKDALNRFRKRADGFSGEISDLLNDDTDGEEKSRDKQSTFLPYSKDINAIKSMLDDMSKKLDAVSDDKSKNSDLMASFSNSIYNIDKKLNDISSSLSGVNKINDSIFDLKNSQINTRNSLGELELSFKRLKKKTNAGIIILSIISALIAILEIINILS